MNITSYISVRIQVDGKIPFLLSVDKVDLPYKPENIRLRNFILGSRDVFLIKNRDLSFHIKNKMDNTLLKLRSNDK